ncbi:MAG: hypothetical protein R6U95_00520 [Bacteroidales bacterium]
MKLVIKYTNANGLYPGIGGIIVCIAIFVALINFGLQNYSGIFISILIFIIGYVGFFSKVSITHNPKHNSLTIVTDYFFKKTTETYSLDTYQYVQILYTIGRAKQRKFGYLETTWKKTQSKHFDVYIISFDTKCPPVLIKPFVDKNKAFTFLHDIAAQLQLQSLPAKRIG